MYNSPAESTTISCGKLNSALVAGPPSPQLGAVSHCMPFPAIRVIVPDGETIRTSLPWSAIDTSPAESTATPVGCSSSALVAEPPSPQPPGGLLHTVPLPAIRLIVPEGETIRTSWSL